MKLRALVFLLCVFVALPALCSAGDKGSVTVKPDPVIPGNYRVYGSKGQLKETWKADPVVPGQYRVEDLNGKSAGFIKPDPVFPNSNRSALSPSAKK